jgi:hypothetical protein
MVPAAILFGVMALQGVAAETMTVQPARDNAMLVNPGKGWVQYYGTDKYTDNYISVGYGRHTVRNSALIGNAQPSQFLGEPSDVADNVQEGATSALDTKAWTLMWRVPAAGLSCKPVAGIALYVFGQPRAGEKVCAGPFAKPVGNAEKLSLWPNLSAAGLLSPGRSP